MYTIEKTVRENGKETKEHIGKFKEWRDAWPTVTQLYAAELSNPENYNGRRLQQHRDHCGRSMLNFVSDDIYTSNRMICFETRFINILY